PSAGPHSERRTRQAMCLDEVRLVCSADSSMDASGMSRKQASLTLSSLPAGWPWVRPSTLRAASVAVRGVVGDADGGGEGALVAVLFLEVVPGAELHVLDLAPLHLFLAEPDLVARGGADEAVAVFRVEADHLA